MIRNFFVLILLLFSTVVLSAPSKYEVLKALKWRAIHAMEQCLVSGKLSFEEKQKFEYTIYKIKSSIAQFTDASYFEDLYHQTYHLVQIKPSLENSAQRSEIDNLLEYYQSLLQQLQRERN